MRLLFDDGQHLVLEIHLAHVNAIAPSSPIPHAFFFGDERQNRIHQRALPAAELDCSSICQRFQTPRHGRDAPPACWFLRPPPRTARSLEN
jgi:hypothetical protein